jgi:hypothetical protein
VRAGWLGLDGEVGGADGLAGHLGRRTLNEQIEDEVRGGRLGLSPECCRQQRVLDDHVPTGQNLLPQAAAFPSEGGSEARHVLSPATAEHPDRDLTNQA